MRRKLAVVALAVGMLATVACSKDDDGGGQSTEAVCDSLNQQLQPLDAELNTAMSQAGLAAGQGDEAALAEAVAQLDDVVGRITEVVRGGAEDAEDEEFRNALNTFADEMENLADTAANGEMPDMTAFEAARSEVESYCGA
ncbi:MAG TPA: hypothetical protein VIL37_02235 [Natronosporangium sp.]